MTTRPATRFTHVRTYANGVKDSKGKRKLCLHCGSLATIAANRRRNGFELSVRYCAEHAQLRGAL